MNLLDTTALFSSVWLGMRPEPTVRTTKWRFLDGATIRFDPESKHDANAGLNVAMDKLEEIKKQFPWISYGDLYTRCRGCH